MSPLGRAAGDSLDMDQTPTSTEASQLAPALRGREYWRSVEDQARSPQFKQWLEREFQDGAAELSDADRRSFIKLMGASVALAGFGLAGCRRWPETNIVPFAGPPSDRVPGVAVAYATSFSIRGIGEGVLARTFDGRPVKLDGNAEHVSGAGSTAILQSRILELYEPHRSRQVTQHGHAASMVQFEVWLGGRRAELRANGGADLAFLVEAANGPSDDAMRGRLRQAFPKAMWCEYEAAGYSGEADGTTAAFGSAQRVRNDFAKAKVIVSLDADFLSGRPGTVADAAGFAAGRRLDESSASHATMSRLYCVDGGLTLTGMSADERVAVRASDVAAIAAQLAVACGLKGNGLSALAARAPKLSADDTARLGAAALELNSNRGAGLVVAGDRQPAAVHAIAALLNASLGNLGKTVTCLPLAANGSNTEFAALATALGSGQIKTLVTIGGNPVFDAPGMAEAISKVAEHVRLSLWNDETSLAGKGAMWHIPRAHFLEAWNDTRAVDGSVSIAQPLIMPLVGAGQGGLSEIEFAALLLGDDTAGGEAIVRRTHTARTGLSGGGFETAWRAALDKGIWAGSATAGGALPATNVGAVDALATAAAAAAPAADSLEVAFHFDAKVDDGRFGNLAWLQELPDNVSKLTWDNALLVSPATARSLGISGEDMVRVSVNGATLECVAWVLPGQPDGSLGIALGYGRGAAAGPIADGAGFNAYTIRPPGVGFVSGATVSRVGSTYELARTQDHGAANALSPEIAYGGIQERLPTLVREGTLNQFQTDPGFARKVGHVVSSLSLWEESNLDGAQFRWAMSIDLGSCTGCSACVTACQAENNIPVVGKGQVMRGREMFWIRIDRYFKGPHPDAPDGFAVQPVTCQQCENAPCEQVCPVGATTHDTDGLNVMVYNRCIGTRYCSNNCPYKVRRFNFFDWHRRSPERGEGIIKTDAEYYTREGAENWLRMQFNPDVTVRMRGIMEKCTFCTQRIQAAKITGKNAWANAGGAATGAPNFLIPDGTIVTACQQACPTGAIVFGDLNDANSRVSKLHKQGRSYQMLEELNVKPRVKYMARVNNPALTPAAPAAGHGHDGAHG